jgi:hypothetical protein
MSAVKGLLQVFMASPEIWPSDLLDLPKTLQTDRRRATLPQHFLRFYA